MGPKPKRRRGKKSERFPGVKPKKEDGANKHEEEPSSSSHKNTKKDQEHTSITLDGVLKISPTIQSEHKVDVSENEPSPFFNKDVNVDKGIVISEGSVIREEEVLDYVGSDVSKHESHQITDEDHKFTSITLDDVIKISPTIQSEYIVEVSENEPSPCLNKDVNVDKGEVISEDSVIREEEVLDYVGSDVSEHESHQITDEDHKCTSITLDDVIRISPTIHSEYKVEVSENEPSPCLNKDVNVDKDVVISEDSVIREEEVLNYDGSDISEHESHQITDEDHKCTSITLDDVIKISPTNNFLPHFYSEHKLEESEYYPSSSLNKDVNVDKDVVISEDSVIREEEVSDYDGSDVSEHESHQITDEDHKCTSITLDSVMKTSPSINLLPSEHKLEESEKIASPSSDKDVYVDKDIVISEDSVICEEKVLEYVISHVSKHNSHKITEEDHKYASITLDGVMKTSPSINLPPSENKLEESEKNASPSSDKDVNVDKDKVLSEDSTIRGEKPSNNLLQPEPCNRRAPTTYELHKFQKNYMVIFNQVNIDGYEERLGTGVDVKVLKSTFIKFGFEIEDVLNPDKKKIMDVLDTFKSKDFTDYGCVAVVVLTHGTVNGGLRAKDQEYNEEDIIEYFREHNDTLDKKPKLFIIQACRGEECTPAVEVLDPFTADVPVTKNTTRPTSTSYNLTIPADTLVIHSSYIGQPSARHEIFGSWLIQTLCEKLNTRAAIEDVESILREVKREIALDRHWIEYDESNNEVICKQMPTVTSTLTRDLCFSQLYCSCFVDHFSYIRKCLMYFVNENPEDSIAQGFLEVSNTFDDGYKFNESKKMMGKAISQYLESKADKCSFSKYVFYGNQGYENCMKKNLQ